MEWTKYPDCEVIFGALSGAAEGKLVCLSSGILHTGDLDHLRIEDCRKDVLVNYMGTVHLIVHAARVLRRGARLICVSSVAGLKGMPEFPGYCASKFAVYGFCEANHADLQRKGIDLSVLCPPAIDTPMVRNLPERPVLYDIFPFAPKEQVIESIVRAIDQRKQFLILVVASVETQMQASLKSARAKFQHRGNKGADVEGAVREFLRTFLPRRLSVGHGEVVDTHGGRSGQTDVVIANDEHPFTFEPLTESSAFSRKSSGLPAIRMKRRSGFVVA